MINLLRAIVGAWLMTCLLLAIHTGLLVVWLKSGIEILISSQS